MEVRRRINNINDQNEILINYFYSAKKTRFLSLLKITSKWKELYKSKEAILSFIISILSSIIWCYIFDTVSIDVFNQIIREFTLSIFSALIGMLGFIISGLAILTGTITKKLIDSINNKGLVKHLISILYSFYFIGAFIGVVIFAYILMYLLSFSDLPATYFYVAIISFILSYLFCFAILYSIALLGTCLRIFILSYKFSDANN